MGGRSAHDMRRALAGVRVVSLAQNVPGPVAVSRLVGYGAAAVKIEPPGGDPLRGFSLAWYRRLHRGVRVERVGSEVLRRTGPTACAARAGRPADDQPAAVGVGSARVDHAASGRDSIPSSGGCDIVGDTRRPERPGHDLTYQAEVGLLGAEMPRTLVARPARSRARGFGRPAAAATSRAVHLETGLRDAVQSRRPLRTNWA